MDSEDEFEVDKEYFMGEPYHPLPFPCFPQQWYAHQGRLAQSNAARKRARELNPIDTNEAGDLVSLKRSQVEGSLETNTEHLAHQISNLKDKPSTVSSLSHLNAVHKVAE